MMLRDLARLRTARRPVLLFYCQHSLGIGHLHRSFALAQALAEYFHVVFLNGGRRPPGIAAPDDVDMIDLPALGMDDEQSIVSRDAMHDVASARAQRGALIRGAVLRHRPAMVLIELFPFGRKKFAGEILELIKLARLTRSGRTHIVCSLRDILVDARRDQQRHDDRARWLTDRYFDAVLVHADPALARLEDSFRPGRPLRTPVHYTGYVLPVRPAAPARERAAHLLVSAGGGIVGWPLFDAVLRARTQMSEPRPLRLVTGPFLPEAQWQALRKAAAAQSGVQLLRQVPDLAAEMRGAAASISQCGYNTALDVIVSGVPALVLPYETPVENEQLERARKLAALGALRYARAHELTPAALADELQALPGFSPHPATLALDGAARSAELLRQLIDAPTAPAAVALRPVAA